MLHDSTLAPPGTKKIFLVVRAAALTQPRTTDFVTAVSFSKEDARMIAAIADGVASCDARGVRAGLKKWSSSDKNIQQ